MATSPAIRDCADGVLSWRSCGSPAAPLAVFFHGLGGDRFAWDPQLAALAGLRHCCAWELPGYGDSPGLPGSLPELAALAAGWIEGLGGSADVVGLSFGGMVAQHLALECPRVVRSLCLLDTSPAFGFDGVTDPQAWLSSRITPLRQPGRDERTAAVVAALVGPDATDSVRRQVAASMAAIPAASLEASCRALIGHDVRARLGEIRAPALVMVGEHDTETPAPYAQALAAGIAAARLQVVPGAGHLANLEAPEFVTAAIRSFWARGEAAA